MRYVPKITRLGKTVQVNFNDLLSFAVLIPFDVGLDKICIYCCEIPH